MTEAQKPKVESNAYDPFAERTDPHLMTNWQTFAHLVKAVMGTGLLSMPFAFRNSGWVVGIGGTILTGFICSYCAYTLVKCAHILYHTNQRSAMSYAEVAESAFLSGPERVHALAIIAKYFVLGGCFAIYFGICAVYTVLVSSNILSVSKFDINVRFMILMLVIPLILLAYVPNLKYLAPFSVVAIILMASCICITIYYLVQNIPNISERDYAHFKTLPPFFAICIFAMQAIGHIMLLENNMKTPQKLIGVFGILPLSMIILTILYGGFGILGYFRYGNDTEETITLNLPNEEWLAKSVKIFIALAVFLTFGLQMIVCVQIVWDAISHHFTKHPVLANYTLRTIMVCIAVCLALIIPRIAPFMGLIGACCFSLLGIIFPEIIELMVLWNTGWGFCYWILWKNIIIMIIGVIAMVFGTIQAVQEISKWYYT